MKEHYLLDPDIIFLNHGSFGATPKPVFAAYQNWQRRLEKQPVLFLGRERHALLKEARGVLAEYLGTTGENLVYVPNATFGVNVVAQGLKLGAGDEVLTSDHEYGACDRAWRFMSREKGFTLVHRPIPLPVTSPEEVAENFWQGVTPNTKVIFLSHITSFTALRLPVELICQRAREAGILTVIDGAHAPAQLPLDLPTIGADFYTGNCHKWLSSPKGAAFLYARPEVQPLLDPLVVSWGWESEAPSGSPYVDYFEWWGTKDPAAYLSVPAAIEFQRTHDTGAVKAGCHALARETMLRIAEITGQPLMYPADSEFYSQMFICLLPQVDVAELKTGLYDDYQIEVPILTWQDKQFIRVTVQGYNTREEMDRLCEALRALLPS